MKIATWNINGIHSRIAHVIEWSKAEQPDVLCLQETKTIDSRFPHRKLHAAGFPHVEFYGEKSYNGVAILSRHPITAVEKGLSDESADQPRRVIAGTIDGIRVINVYAPHGTRLGSDKFDYKLRWFPRMRAMLDLNFDNDDAVILCGDMNVAPHELDVWKPSLWKDKTHFSRPERDALVDLKRWGFTDLYRHFNPEEHGFTWWDVFRTSSFEKDRGMRLDHIWASPAIADDFTDCWVAREPRGWEHPSDHAPVVAITGV